MDIFLTATEAKERFLKILAEVSRQRCRNEFEDLKTTILHVEAAFSV